MDYPKVTFGIINCNRLHYLKSCVESLLYCTSDYPNKEIIIVDNSSIEKGTDEYLLEKENQGISVFKSEKRDPNNEFAKALNLITRESSGDYIAQIQGDMQFILKGEWLKEYVRFYSKHKNNIGCVMLDAQRSTRIKNQSKFSKKSNDLYPFLFDLHRIPFCCSADVMYSRESLNFMGPFLEKNDGHETGTNSEDDMRSRILSKISGKNAQIFCAAPLIPPAVAIYTDPRGTNARVRGNKRYGSYWPPKVDNFRYYQVRDFNDMSALFANREKPVGIEEMAIPEGWSAPIDSNGDWIKNPIIIENCSSDDYVVLYEEKETLFKNHDHIEEWLNDK
jgi:glycosyltransferase involved in cell wall biosynthesis